MKLPLLIIVFLMGQLTFSQSDDIEELYAEACNCIDEIKISIEEEEKADKINDCISTAIVSKQINESVLGLMKKAIDTINGADTVIIDSLIIEDNSDIIIDITKNYKNIEEYLLRNCFAMKSLLSSRDIQNENSVSDKRRAKKLFDKGQGLFSKGEYGKAIFQYKKAIKADSNFAFAFDMIGYSYRKLENYEKAVTYYKKSIEIDPKGKMPLINLAYAYEFQELYKEAIEAFNNYLELFPDDAEGFYGRGRIHHLKLDYENALDDMMKAFVIYNEFDSPYARDAEANLSLFYNELEEKNQLDLFKKAADKNGLKIN